MKFIIKKWLKKELKYNKLDIQHREYLKETYKEDVNELKNSLNYEFSEWKDFN